MLIPSGCGLSRLPFEIACEGFMTIANEQDVFQLLTANYIMNHCDETNKNEIFPWIHDLSNRHQSQETLKSVSFPDIDPVNSRPENFNLEMMNGEFNSSADEQLGEESVDVIVTSFFLETSGSNPLNTLDTIHKILKQNGIWINFGSLNFACDQLPLDWEMLKKVIKEYKFEFIKDEIVESAYVSNQKTSTNFSCAFFSCKKL